MEIITAGRTLWDGVPSRKYTLQREELFQQGMQEHTELLEGYEVFPGRVLLDPTPGERYDIAERGSDEMTGSPPAYMDSPGAAPVPPHQPIQSPNTHPPPPRAAPAEAPP